MFSRRHQLNEARSAVAQCALDGRSEFVWSRDVQRNERSRPIKRPFQTAGIGQGLAEQVRFGRYRDRRMVMIHLAMLLAFEFPDWDADTATGKRTPVVRLGREPAAYVHTALITVATLLLLTAALDRPAARYEWLMTPLAAWQVLNLVRHARHRGVGLPLLTLGAVSLFVLTAVLWLLGFATL